MLPLLLYRSPARSPLLSLSRSPTPLLSCSASPADFLVWLVEAPGGLRCLAILAISEASGVEELENNVVDNGDEVRWSKSHICLLHVAFSIAFQLIAENVRIQ